LQQSYYPVEIFKDSTMDSRLKPDNLDRRRSARIVAFAPS